MFAESMTENYITSFTTLLYEMAKNENVIECGLENSEKSCLK